ncbi:cofactor-independent phosphoglycerate mutase [bacterium]|nr:cofactor-independent phosphoglycerate mutase [bacterium]MBU0899287.1 cofactor-independent phosphoglycerate mutase [bacterium]MBU1153282.1 cofactor-independent phosphoglycerate mutase [bacterium]
MKYIIIVGDGMADYPLEELGNKTPLQVARTPNFDKLAKGGMVGLAKTIPDGLSPGSDVANLSILGYDPNTYYPGRASLEAISQGIILEKEEIAFRCNLVTVEDGIMIDYSGGHITTLEAEKFIALLNQRMGKDNLIFYPGVSYRNLIITSLLPVESLPSLICFPPHDITGKNILEYLPNHELIKEIMFTSQNILKENKLNLERKQSNKKEVSMVWLWGPGSLPSMPKFSDLFSLKGANIAAVDLIKGISKSIGFEVIKVTGATGYYDTDYQAKANYALQALEEFDLVYIHIEAPDEASHNGEISEKIKAIEEIDQKVLGTILEKVERYQDYKILLITDHYTPVSLKTHTKEIVPFIVYGTSIEKDDIVLFDEESAKDSSLYFEEGYKLMEWFINK